MSDQWSIEILPTSGGGVGFRPDVPGAKIGNSLRAQLNDLVSWSNRTNLEITLRSTNPAGLPLDQKIGPGRTTGLFLVETPTIEYESVKPHATHTIEPPLVVLAGVHAVAGSQLTGFQQVQDALDRILGGSLANHGAFWRGKTRDAFVQLKVFGLPIIVVGKSEDSNLVRALRGVAPFGADLQPRPTGAFLPRMPHRHPPADERDIALIEQWIRSGCPEVSSSGDASGAAVAATDDTHLRYWRAIDDFFHPSLGSEETVIHVGRLHIEAFRRWRVSEVTGVDPDLWLEYLSMPDVAESFAYIRFHQRRLVGEYYSDSQDDLFDSLWKFGGSLLPPDPESHMFPEHRMNAVIDWFFWSPYLDASLRAADANAGDVSLARAWQVGLVADGLLRRDPERPENERMPITDFSATQPDLRASVEGKYAAADTATLLREMVRRARESGSV